MNVFAKKYLGFLAVLLIWGMATSYPTEACIDDGPPLERNHSIYLLGQKSLGSKSSPFSLQTFDLVSVVLPRGRVDDWQVEIVESEPGLLRAILPQELSGILDSKRFSTYSRQINEIYTEPGKTRLHFGMLRPGRVHLRIKRKGGKENYQLFLNIVARPPVEPKKQAPHREGEPVPAC
jgi:hypothetical protein